ncbi:hypothetical protein HDU87_001176 [Geranomyces variabilis]|uniref:Uncharacterized protein n=1 Tax=Geranomyces variabilis TaxID=109894 RepID=A0AAD5TBP6_9FUNG|nr:hypothetical protein HDU87_001176 [Geranomyces variabilis]
MASVQLDSLPREIHLAITDWTLHAAIQRYLHPPPHESAARALDSAAALGHSAETMLKALSAADREKLADRTVFYEVVAAMTHTKLRQRGQVALLAIVPLFLELSSRVVGIVAPKLGPTKIMRVWYEMFLKIQIQAAVEAAMWGKMDEPQALRTLLLHDMRDFPVLKDGIRSDRYREYQNHLLEARNKSWSDLHSEHPLEEFQERIREFLLGVYEEFPEPALLPASREPVFARYRDPAPYDSGAPDLNMEGAAVMDRAALVGKKRTRPKQENGDADGNSASRSSGPRKVIKKEGRGSGS